jgi:hypothetical protein
MRISLTLKIHGVVVRLDAEALALQSVRISCRSRSSTVAYSLEWPDPGTFDDLEGLDSCTSDGEILVRGGDCVNHLE